MRIIARIFFFVAISVCFCTGLKAQVKRTLTGVVADSTKLGIPGSNIRLIAGKDTLSINSDNDGKFAFNTISSENISLLIRSIGYRPFTGNYTFKDKQAVLDLGQIVLKTDTQLLKEVEIKGKVIAMKVKKDTLEYNAAAYIVREGDRVDELLKQLPGVVVDDKGKVTSMGKELTKIRVNGKDFFTGNVAEFIKQLPAEMVSHIQVIDDYGDKANVTGIKTGEPKKLLNLVTKPGRNRGVFGQASAEAGTNDLYGFQAQGNSWKDTRQLGLQGNLNNSNNSAGSSRAIRGNVNVRDQITKSLNGSAAYSIGNNNSKMEQLSYVERVNPLGTIFSNDNNSSDSKSNNHNFDLNVNGTMGKEFLTASLNGSFADSKSDSRSESIQKGGIRQDLYNIGKSTQKNPNLSGNFGWGKGMAKKGRTLFINASGTLGNSTGAQDLINRTVWYNKVTEEQTKDSLVHRLVDNRNSTNSLNATVSYSEPLNNPLDTVSTKNLDFSYSFSVNATRSSLATNVRNKDGVLAFVDSLSNAYHSIFINNNFQISYRYGAKKLSYSAGISLQPSILTGSYEGRNDRISQQTLNFSPSGVVNYVINAAQSFSANYSGSSNAPDFQQLQPVPDTRDLQNTIIGNPDLKTSFTHSGSIDYRLFSVTSGASFQAGINTSLIQNQVVANVVQDTSKGLKQITRYVNANGNYNMGSMFIASVPFGNRKFALTMNGNLGYSNTVLFIENEKNFSRSLNYLQQLGLSLNTMKLNLSGNIMYSLNTNSYSLATSEFRKIESWTFNLNNRWHVTKSLLLNINASKRINSGYSISANNPLLLNASVEQALFKNQIGLLSLKVNDLLNQGNGLNRSISDNTVTESRTSQVTRYFLLSFAMRIRDFRGMRSNTGSISRSFN